MTLLKVAPDKSFMITEARLRFPVDAHAPYGMIPLIVASDLKKSIENLEKFRGWHVLETVPSRKQFPANMACCEQMLKPSGTALKIRFMPSDFQGDPDDATNFNEVADDNHRLLVEAIVDWVAIVHFWEPAVHVNMEEVRDDSRSLAAGDGFMDWKSIPAHAWPELRKRYEPWHRQ